MNILPHLKRSAIFALVFVCAHASLGQQPADALSTARALVNSGKLTQSEKVLHSFIAENPTSADAYFLLGYVYFREKKPRESLAAFTEGARFRRPAADDFRVIASAYVLLGDYADAEKWFSEVTRDRPNDADAWYLLGRSQYNENHFKDAIASFERVLKLRPNDVAAENNMGLAWQGLNEDEQAMAAFQQAIAWQGSHPTDAQPYLNLGTSLDDRNQFEKALPWLRQAAALAPRNPKVHEELARALEECNRTPEAQTELEKAIALAPNASGPHFKLGRLYQREGLRDLAKQQFEICQKLDSTHSSIDTPNPYKQN